MSSAERGGSVGLAYGGAAPRRSRRQTLHGYLSLARVSNSPTVVSNVLAGAALGGALRPDAATILLAVASVLFYTAGMFLNDLCDYEIDRRQRPERPLPAGTVSRPAAAATTVALFAVGGLLLWLAGPRPFVGGLVLLAIIVAYDVWHKTNPLSPLVMSAARLMVYVIAFFTFSTDVTTGLVVAGGLLVLYVVGLTYIAKCETKPSVGNYWPAVVLLLPVGVYGVAALLGTPLSVSSAPLLLALLALFGAWVAYSISFVYRPQGRNIGGAIARLIAGMSLYDAVVLVVAGALVSVPLALAAFGATLFLQRFIRGT
jgi:hypothetical protein